MATTVNRGYSVPATGSQVGIWGSDDLNPNFALIDNNLGGVATVSLSNISPVNLDAAQYQCGTIRFVGTMTANVIVNFPTVSAWWTVDNQTTGGFNIELHCTGGPKWPCAPPGETVDIYADGTNMFYRNLGRIGSYLDYSGSAVPGWIAASSPPPYLLCGGGTFDATVYPVLNSILGGNTLPDYRGRARFYLNDGTGRVTTAGSGINGDAVSAAGGAQAVTLTTNQIPSHSHNNTLNDPGHSHPYVGPTDPSQGLTSGFFNTPLGTQSRVTSGSLTGMTISNANAGGGTAHTNMPPAAMGGITMMRAA